MNTRLLLAFALLATLAASARASFYFTWNAPGSVNVGQNYTVGVQAYFTPNYSGDPYAVLGLYRNGSQIGGGSTGAYGSATASNSFTDNSAQTVGYSADMYSYYGETGYSSHSVTVTGAPVNNPPTAWVTADGQSHGATITRPYGGSINVTVRYKASDPDNNLARIRPQVWHPSGYLNNNGGNFIGQSGGYGEVAWTVTLNENGNWHFWTDAEDTNNVFVNSGAWGSGFRLTVVEGSPPNTPPTVTLHSPAAQTIYLNQALTITSQATDPNGNISNHNLDIQRPDGSWNWQGGFANGEPYTGGYSGSPSNSNRSASFTFNQLGTWYVRSAAADPSGWYHSATVAINVIPNDITPPNAPENLQVSNRTSTGFTISWSAPSGEAVVAYRISRDGGEFIPKGTAMSHSFDDMAPNSQHNIQVQACDQNGNWSASATLGVWTDGAVGNQPNASVWMDTDGDGIRDEIVRPKTDAFNYSVAVWFTPVVQYMNHPLNNFWSVLDMFFFGTEADRFGWKFHDSSAPAYIGISTRFGLVFDIQLAANEPFKVYRDLTDSDQIAPGNWEYIFGSTTGPAYGAIHEFSWQVPNPFQLVNSKYFVVKKGRPVGGLRFQLANNATMDVNTSGVFGGITLEGGVKITVGGGQASVTGYGNVSANGSMSLPNGTVVAVNSSGEASITLPNGIQVKVNTQGKVSLTVPPGLSGITARVLDIAGRVLDVVNNGVVFSVKNVLGQIINLPSGGILDELPDIGLNVMTGSILIGARLGTQADNQTTWVPIEVPVIEFQARTGRINDGFDPPLNETQDQNAQRVWHTSVGKETPNNNNDIVKLVFPTAAQAAEYELVVPQASQAHVDVSPKQFSAKETDLTIVGKNGATGQIAAEILLKKKSDGSVAGTLIVDVMPWHTINLKVFKVEPGALYSQGRITAELPSIESVQAELNARFRQACISFNVSAYGSTEFVDYDAGLRDGIFQVSRWIKIGPGAPIADRTEEESFISAAATFNGQLNVVFVKLLGDTTTDRTVSPELNQTTSDSTSGTYFRGEGALQRCVFISADFSGFQQPSNVDGNCAVRTVQRVIAHEIGHSLGLSTRQFIPFPILGIPENHDNDATPAGTKALMRPGAVGPQGKWMRHEDWREANDTAGGLIQ